MIIDDDFLSVDVVKEIEQSLTNDAHWVLTKELISRDFKFNVDVETYHGFQFNHVFFAGHKQRSDLYDLALRTLEQFCLKNNISLRAIMRAKANMTFPDSNVDVELTKAVHTDHSWPHLVFLYYVNDADGDTILYNETYDDNKPMVLTEMSRVSPKAGRAICFQGLHYHSPLVPTKGYRMVINITFIGEFYDN